MSLRLERHVLRSAAEALPLAVRLRALAPSGADVGQGVASIVAAIRDGGDDALREHIERLDTGGAPAPPLLVSAGELDDAAAALEPAVRAGLEMAIANVGAVAAAGVAADRNLTLGQGQRIVLREVPVRRAAIYVPGGRAPYPSTVVMGVVTALAAGVTEVVVATPPASDGDAHPVVLGAAALCGVTEVVRAGGAHAIAALAYGTETVAPVDVIAGPGNLWVQEAKRQCSAVVGLEGFAGPSDLLVIAAEDAPVAPLALDLLAQGEHGPESVVVLVSDEEDVLDAVAVAAQELAGDRPSSNPAALVTVHAADLDAAIGLSDAFAPEHLQLVGMRAEALAPRVRNAGCVLVGAESGTAFADYIAGSNHVLPTGGAARFASGLGPRHFRRRITEVHVGAAAGELSAAAAAVARAEGFVVHAESMEAR